MGKFYYDKKGYPRWRDSDLLVHRTVAKPEPGEHTHHKEGNKKDFRHKSLENMSPSDHTKLHARKRRQNWI